MVVAFLGSLGGLRGVPCLNPSRRGSWVFSWLSSFGGKCFVLCWGGFIFLSFFPIVALFVCLLVFPVGRPSGSLVELGFGS